MIKKRRVRFSKKAQDSFSMSFTMIFSILLIVFFIIVAFIAINSFLSTQKCVQAGIFITDFKNEIKTAFDSPKYDSDFSRAIPSSIEYVCFADFSRDPIFSGDNEKKIAQDIWLYKGNSYNLFLYPQSGACNLPYQTMENLDIKNITLIKNPYCIPTSNSKINIKIEKGLSDSQVLVK